MNYSKKNDNKRTLFQFKRVRDIVQGSGIYFALLMLIIILGFVSPSLVSLRHILNITRQASALGIVAIGQTFVIMNQGVDFSVGATVTLIEILTAGMVSGRDEMILPVVLFCLFVGALIGLINGIAITKLKLVPFVMTLVMSSMITGIYLIYTGGSPRGRVPEFLRFIGGGRIGNFFPAAIVVLIIVSVIFFLVLRFTIFGRHIYFSGANPIASYFSGIKVDLVIIINYVISGLCAAIAGILLAGYIGTGSLEVGSEYTLNSIAAVLMGGTLFSGGRGGIGGSIGGALALTFLFSLLTILGMPHSGKLIMRGLIIITVVLLSTCNSENNL